MLFRKRYVLCHCLKSSQIQNSQSSPGMFARNRWFGYFRGPSSKKIHNRVVNLPLERLPKFTEANISDRSGFLYFKNFILTLYFRRCWVSCISQSYQYFHFIWVFRDKQCRKMQLNTAYLLKQCEKSRPN